MIEFKKISDKLMFKTTKEFADDLAKDWDALSDKLPKLEKYDTKDIKPMSHISQSSSNELREDKVSSINNRELILKNAPASKDGSIVLPKVVKND